MALDLAKQQKFQFKLLEKLQENQIQMKLFFNQNHPNGQKNDIKLLTSSN